MTSEKINSSEMLLRLTEQLLARGCHVRFQVHGTSMHPAIRDGEAIIVGPVRTGDVRRGDILLFTRGGRPIAHRVTTITRVDNSPAFLLSGEAASSAEGPVTPEQIIGRVLALDRRGCCVRLDARTVRWSNCVRMRAAQIKRRLLAIATRCRVRPAGSAPQARCAK
jgi:signal peptidase I